MMNIVAALPPPNGHARAEAREENANERVDNEVVSDGAMAGIVRCERDLMLHPRKRQLELSE